MKKLLNVLYVTKPETYLSLENENVIVKEKDELISRVTLLNLEGIVHFGYNIGISPSLIAECVKRNIAVTFLTENGKYQGSVIGESRGNVIVRKEQYRISDDKLRSCLYARNFIFGKLHNSKWILERATRDYGMRVDCEAIKKETAQITVAMKECLKCEDLELLRAIEGNAAQSYFRVFDELILQNKHFFKFDNRNRRPPTDPMNALLSFAYVLLAAECRNALEGVGIDAYVGFLHRDKSGRASLALDLMEELRSCFADRFVLSLINRGEITPTDFKFTESGAVLINDDAKKRFLSAWQNKKKEMITHPFLQEKCQWGLVPHLQALLLSRVIRGDLEEYPTFLWK
ncbi:MAG: type I-C CRISPR-associated endonuclease Cas1c [Christensenellaceae bacterium]|jgi:CRISPR-associated protein Cas1|nr:type I-C CRISPR-associated endonuclease Cas1c [Christensenellaceae bacterium]